MAQGVSGRRRGDQPQGATEGPVGYRRPPASGRFKPGQSGNPKGRPRGRTRGLPYDAALGQSVEIRLDGESRRVTAAEALLVKLVKSGLSGDTRIAELIHNALEFERAERAQSEADRDLQIV